MYEYRAKVISVYDADTIRVNVSLGFGVENNGLNGKGMKLRLFGIDAPEMRGEEKEQGKRSRDYLRGLIDGKEIIIKTVKDRTGKYGRYLAHIYLDGLYINDYLVDQGYAIYKKY